MKTWALIEAAIARHGACALVTVISSEGSAPRDAGARLVVTAEGFHGTIGGGTLEWRALAAAQAMLGKGTAMKRSTHSLGPDLGQCCGGRVTLETRVFDRTSLGEVAALREREPEQPLRQVYLFGAGHVGKALVLSLAPLPFDVRWIDPRPNAFPGAVPRNVTCIASEEPESILRNAPQGSLAFVMSHSHALDLAICDAALRNMNIARTGLIGSATKRVRFERRLLEGGVPEPRVKSLICPIGIGGIRSKEPAAIALATAAQVLSLHEELQRQETVAPSERASA
ncbi:MAG: xanthine dehydrogenase accessory protein XdhC [Aestuariivirga sp.]